MYALAYKNTGDYYLIFSTKRKAENFFKKMIADDEASPGEIESYCVKKIKIDYSYEDYKEEIEEEMEEDINDEEMDSWDNPYDY